MSEDHSSTVIVTTTPGESEVHLSHLPECHKHDQIRPLHSKFLVACVLWIFANLDSVTSLIFARSIETNLMKPEGSLRKAILAKANYPS